MVWRKVARGVRETVPPLSPCVRYFWRSHCLNKKSGSAIFAALFEPQTKRPGAAGIATLLESPASLPSTGATALARYSICAGAPRLVQNQYQFWTPELGHILPFLARLSRFSPPLVKLLPNESQPPPKSLPFLGGWLGWLGYDLAWEIERLPWLKEDCLPFPIAFWYEPAEFALIDHTAQRLWIAAETLEGVERLSKRFLSIDFLSADREDKGIYRAESKEEKDKEKSKEEEGKERSSPSVSRRAAAKRAVHSRASLSQQTTELPTNQLKFETDRAEFQQAVEQAKAHIRAGDVFQVNHSLRFQAQTSIPSWEVYKKLHAINPSPFASYWHTPWGQVVSCSPERLVHLASGVAQSRPIAGTRPRGQTIAEDEMNARSLMSDRKEQAEHIMLVDLERNDLGRVCRWGSVQVDELMTIERYSHVMHLVSNVTGQLPPAVSVAQLVAALFPGGTITGCPKVRCMEIIETLEPVRRSLFYGSCGYLDRRGRLDLNILIRTLLMTPNAQTIDTQAPNAQALDAQVLDAQTPDIQTPNAAGEEETLSPISKVWGQVGAGIVADSEPAREWQESLQKAEAQLLALGL